MRSRLPLPTPLAALLLPLLLLAAPPAAAQLTVRVDALPAGTPPAARIHVAGSFNGWQPGDTAWMLRRTGAGAWALTFPDTVRGAVAFKLTLGSWDRVEVDAAGRDVPNRTVTVPPAGAVAYAATVARWKAAADPGRRSTTSPTVRVVADSFRIPQLGRTRRVWVYLPPFYAAAPARRWPVLYLHDGQNVFDAATSFAGEWGVDESLDSLGTRGDHGVIVVAVDNGGEHRLSEYDPWPLPDPRMGRGREGGAYVDFLVRTLKPWVDARWRTLPGPQHTGIAGSSMGGLISLYAALRHPEVFGRAGVLSCACWIARDSVLAYARTRTAAIRAAGTPLPRLWFVVGGQETNDDQPARDQAAVVAALRAAGWPDRALRAEVRADGRHTEAFWRREFPAGYRWLFAAAP